MTPLGTDFGREGFSGPFRLLRPEGCAALLQHLRNPKRPLPGVWPKGGAATDWLLAGVGSDPRLLDLLVPILGDNIVLWGTSLVERGPGHVHPWHVDMESASPAGKFVTAWIGLENTTGRSGLRMIAGSHRGRTLQELRSRHGLARAALPTDEVLNLAVGENPDARLVEPEVGDGDVLIFDGRLWHGSHNRLPDQTRAAVLLQYASADSPVRIPRSLNWPFEFVTDPLPPAVLVRGRARAAVNRLVKRPARPEPKLLPALPPLIRELTPAVPDRPALGWQTFPKFKGSTPALRHMACHAAMLEQGKSPHPPHHHDDEELTIILQGEADLLITDRPQYEGAKEVRVKAGDFAFYPSHQHHSLRNAGNAPLQYLMFRWHGERPLTDEGRLQTTVFHDPQPVADDKARGFAIRRIFEGPTRWLRKLHCHTSRLAVGAGYAPHADAYDVAILVQSGRVQTLGREVGPGELIYYPAGQVHGMRNVGNEPARYIVFEFHGLRQPVPAISQQRHLVRAEPALT